MSSSSKLDSSSSTDFAGGGGFDGRFIECGGGGGGVPRIVPAPGRGIVRVVDRASVDRESASARFASIISSNDARERDVMGAAGIPSCVRSASDTGAALSAFKESGARILTQNPAHARRAEGARRKRRN